jgi:hypothetical protein
VLFLGCEAAVLVVDDLVGDAEERVQDVGLVADALGEHARREVERLPGTLVDGLALGEGFVRYHSDSGVVTWIHPV